MRRSQAASAILTAMTLQTCTARLMHFSGRREQHQRELDEFGKGLSLSMPILEDNLGFDEEPNMLSMSVPGGNKESSGSDEDIEATSNGFSWMHSSSEEIIVDEGNNGISKKPEDNQIKAGAVPAPVRAVDSKAGKRRRKH
jgi:hypothetical protein